MSVIVEVDEHSSILASQFSFRHLRKVSINGKNRTKIIDLPTSAIGLTEPEYRL